MKIVTSHSVSFSPIDVLDALKGQLRHDEKPCPPHKVQPKMDISGDGSIMLSWQEEAEA